MISKISLNVSNKKVVKPYEDIQPWLLTIQYVDHAIINHSMLVSSRVTISRLVNNWNEPKVTN